MRTRSEGIVDVMQKLRADLAGLFLGGTEGAPAGAVAVRKPNRGSGLIQHIFRLQGQSIRPNRDSHPRTRRPHFARSHPRLHFGTLLVIQELLRYEKEYKVSERKIFIDEVVERHKRG